MFPRFSNKQMRWALLSLNGLAPAHVRDPLPRPGARSGPAWAREMVRRLGFVQVDPVAAVERAHHHILFSRNSRYRKEDLTGLLERDRLLFENWTHDAAILPVEWYPRWKHYFERAARFEAHPGYRRYFAPVRSEHRVEILDQVRGEGPLRPKDFKMRKVDFRDDFFAAPSLAKITMELLWRTGELAVCHRNGNQKTYDLASRVIPTEHYEGEVSREEYVDWACREALQRLGAGSAAQIARFFDAVSRRDVEAWCRGQAGRDLVEVRVDDAEGRSVGPLWALASLTPVLADPPTPPRRLRLLNPFDPLIHDRRRTARIFGFEYVLEIWIPPAKRRYGYYVLPILEGSRFTGRVDVKVERKQQRLDVLGLWWEPGIRVTSRRKAQLRSALESLANFTGARTVDTGDCFNC